VAVTLTTPPEEAERYRTAGLWTDELIDGFVASRAADDSVALIDGEVLLTHAEVERHVAAVAGALHDLDVRKGDVVSWQLPNWWEAVVLHHSILRCGAVSNPIITTNRRRELEFMLRQAETKVLVHPAVFRRFDYGQMVADLAPHLPALEHTVVVRGAAGGGLAFEALLEADGLAAEVPRSACDPALLMYTSGTTSDPKGVVHPHATLVRENRGIVESWRLTGDDRIFMPSPVTHVTGLLYGVHLPSMVGIPVVLQDVWEPGAALELIERHRCTLLVAATPFLHGLTHSEDLPARDVSSLRFVGCGGADMPPRLIREAEANLGAIVARGYGSTEYPTATQGRVGDTLADRSQTDGRTAPWTELRIVDDEGQDLPANATGELLVRGPERFIGYLVAAADEKVFDADGWFATGDMASIDDDGHLTIQGRKKDIILRGGENISVKEVEDHLHAHPKIAEVAIVAMPDPVMVERACAFVVAAGGDVPTLPELAEYLTGRGLAVQKVPERLERIDELPKNLAGKVQKFKLRERIEALLAGDEHEAQPGPRVPAAGQ
jgi:cyclohexanecarboxylate-CoA ligase